jgi:hypothetical protein
MKWIARLLDIALVIAALGILALTLSFGWHLRVAQHEALGTALLSMIVCAVALGLPVLGGINLLRLCLFRR